MSKFQELIQALCPDDVHYDEQLNGYRTYIESLSSKPVYRYLYSIIDEVYREVIK